MKLLLDQNLSFRLCHQLSDLFPGSSHVRLVGLAEASDRQVWNFALENEFTIVSFDSDFADLVTLLGAPPAVVWIRRGNRPTTVMERLLRENSEPILRLLRGTAGCLELY